MLHALGPVRIGSYTVLSAYPLLPWAAVMAAGFCFGAIYSLDPAARRRWIIRIGLAATIAFFIIRAINAYGDPQPWSTRIPGTVVLSFLRCTKYPPSLVFLLMTLGPALLLLAWFERMSFPKTHPLIVFGRVPLFYFIVHMFVVHALAIPLAWLRYGRAAFVLSPLPTMGGPANVYPAGYGYDLWVIYVIWIGVVAALYPLCRWFANLKARRSDWWLSYL
jgi:uncharacterized membrane protein